MYPENFKVRDTKPPKTTIKHLKSFIYIYKKIMTITLTVFLFLCGLAGFILNRNNVILLIVAIELLLLAVNFKNFSYLPIVTFLVTH